jgi:hypothetical protein
VIFDVSTLGNATADAKTRGEYVEVDFAVNPLGKAKERYEAIFVRATFKVSSPIGKIAAETKKGDRVVVTGRLQQRDYKGKKYLEIPFVNSFVRIPKDGIATSPNADADAPDDDAFPGA